MTNYFIVPGLGNSSEQHWQTFFERSAGNFQRINQSEWDSPKREDWVATIDKAITGHDLTKVVLIGHSLGCLAIIHWALQTGKTIHGAMLVAPSDAEAPNYDFNTSGFAPIPLEPLRFKSIVVASADDKWVQLERAQLFAEKWGSKFINIGRAGHINVESGHTDWSEGLAILQSL